MERDVFLCRSHQITPAGITGSDTYGKVCSFRRQIVDIESPSIDPQELIDGGDCIRTTPLLLADSKAASKSLWLWAAS